MQKHIRYFSMTELLIVIAVIAILAGMLVPVLSGVNEKAKSTAAEQEMTALANLISQQLGKDKSFFKKISSSYIPASPSSPSHVPGSWAELKDSGTLNSFHDYLLDKGYASKKKLDSGAEGIFDVWNNRYRFIVQRADRYVNIWSSGPDGKWCVSSPSDDFVPDREHDSNDTDYIEDDVFVHISF